MDLRKHDPSCILDDRTSKSIGWRGGGFHIGNSDVCEAAVR